MAPNPYFLGGGNNWFEAITFPDSLHGYATDADNPRLMKTTDGGVTWQMKKAPVAGYLCEFITAQAGG